MTRTLARFLPAAVLCAGLALPAAAAQNGTVLELDLIEQGGQVVAVVTLDHLLGLPLELDLEYEVNGNVVKTEPVEVFGPTFYVEGLGDTGGVYSVCASVDGLIRITGDLTRETSGTRCDVWMPSDSGNPSMGAVIGNERAVRRPIRLDTGLVRRGAELPRR